MTDLLLLLQLAAIIAVNIQLRKIAMTNEEYRNAVGDLGTQLIKALAEIQAEIAAIDNVPQAAIDKLTAAQTAAQALDDLNPDAP
jgi:hypothetical protein